MRGPSSLLLLRLLAEASLLALGGIGCSGETASGISGTGSDTTATTTESSSSTDSSSLADDTGVSTGSAFLPNPDLLEGSECDTFAQDCAAGFKCMPWASDGGSSWNATRCTPIADEPAGVGDSCRVLGSLRSGIDDCELGAMCWSVDPETSEGICAALCEGSAVEPFCAAPGHDCALADPVAVCLPLCNPLRDDCLADHVCQLQLGHFEGDWQCLPDASGVMGGYGDPCTLPNECDSGLVCLDAALLPPGDACEGSANCCTEVCDVVARAGDQQCTGADGGQACYPLYGDEGAPPGFEDIGVCAVLP